jgi:lipoprotein-anchoring transpeptidase ErfK/SrfK
MDAHQKRYLQRLEDFSKDILVCQDLMGELTWGGNTYRALAQQLNVKRISVNLSGQIVEAIENGCSIHNFICVSGDSDHPTDRGTFQILRKNHPYRSITYDVQMNYAMFFTQDGKALHQYHGLVPLTTIRTARQQVSDWFGSHGCVRLEEAAARTLYNWTPLSTRVTIF